MNLAICLNELRKRQLRTSDPLEPIALRGVWRPRNWDRPSCWIRGATGPTLPCNELWKISKLVWSSMEKRQSSCSLRTLAERCWKSFENLRKIKVFRGWNDERCQGWSAGIRRTLPGNGEAAVQMDTRFATWTTGFLNTPEKIYPRDFPRLKTIMRTIVYHLIFTSFSCKRSVNFAVVSAQTTTWLQAWQPHVSVGSDVHMSTMGEIRGQWKCEIHPQHRSRGLISAPSRGAGLSDRLRANLWDPMRIVATCQKHGYDMIASLEDRFRIFWFCSFCMLLPDLSRASCNRCVPTSHTDLLSSRVSHRIAPSEIRVAFQTDFQKTRSSLQLGLPHRWSTCSLLTCWNPESLEIVQELHYFALRILLILSAGVWDSLSINFQALGLDNLNLYPTRSTQRVPKCNLDNSLSVIVAHQRDLQKSPAIFPAMHGWCMADMAVPLAEIWQRMGMVCLCLFHRVLDMLQRILFTYFHILSD